MRQPSTAWTWTRDRFSGRPQPAPERVGELARTKGPFRARLRVVWNAVVGGIGFIVGLLPHVLHHVALLAGTALVAGSGGTALFGALGVLASIPLLVKVYKRFGTWRAPAIGLVIFAVMFSLSTFVIGPAVSGAGGAQGVSVPSVNHSEHH